MTTSLEALVDGVAGTEGFSGAIRVDAGEELVLRRAYGHADRAHAVRNEAATRFAIASGMKGITALTVVSLVVDGVLSLTTTARTILGDDLPLVGDDVTVEHLLAPSGRGVMLEGCDAGVSFRSAHDPEHDVTWTVMSNTSDGAWPIARCLRDALES